MLLDDVDTSEFLSQRVAIERELGSRSFYEFYKMAWSVMDPEPFVPGRHIRVIAHHLQRAARREIQRLLICIPPRHSKPVAETALILTDRGRIPLAEVRVGDKVLTHRGRFRPVTAVHEQGELDVLAVTTWTGRRAIMAPDHPLLTTRGWIAAGNLRPGDRAALAPPAEDAGCDALSSEEARFLGYIVGDGSVSIGHPSIVSADPQQIEDIRLCVESLGGKLSFSKKANGKAWRLSLLSGRKGISPHTTDNPLSHFKQILARHDLLGKTSYTKRVPQAVMDGSRRVVVEFLRAYWACDGFIAKRGYGRNDVIIGADTVSRILAEDIQHLLYRLGINARIRTKIAKIKTAVQGDLYTSYTIVLTRQDHAARFADLIEIPHAKQVLLARHKGRTEFDQPLWADEVTGLESVSRTVCRCLTVDEDCSFTANDIVVHNSLLCSVAFPAWVWIWWPSAKFITASYGQPLATRDALACRRLIESPWYQARWPQVRFMGDQNMKTHYQTTAGGVRFVGSPGSGVTGHGSDFNLFDDPHDLTSGESDKERSEARIFWFETMSGRFNAPQRGVSIAIQQRVHDKDVAGECVRRGYYHCVLPARFERKHPQLHEYDWRTAEGEPLWPEKFPEPVLKGLWRDLGGEGSYAVAGQQQQRPQPRSGGLFKRHWFKVLEALPAGIIWVRAWDEAGTEETQDSSDPDYTAGVKIGFHPPTRSYLIGNVVRDRREPGGVTTMIRNTAILDGREVPIFVPQDPGSAGKAHARSRVQDLAGWVVKTDTMSGSKVTRATPLASQAEAGNVYLYRADWNDAFLDELSAFPTGGHDDMVDAAASGFNLFLDSTSGLHDFLKSQAENVKQADDELRRAMGLIQVDNYERR